MHHMKLTTGQRIERDLHHERVAAWSGWVVVRRRHHRRGPEIVEHVRTEGTARWYAESWRRVGYIVLVIDARATNKQAVVDSFLSGWPVEPIVPPLPTETRCVQCGASRQHAGPEGVCLDCMDDLTRCAGCNCIAPPDEARFIDGEVMCAGCAARLEEA